MQFIAKVSDRFAIEKLNCQSWFSTLLIYYVFLIYFIPSSAKVERFSIIYFALVVPAWIYILINWRYLLTGYELPARMLALFALLSGVTSIFRGDFSLGYNAIFISAIAIVILNSKVFVSVTCLNRIFLATIAGSAAIQILGITEYGLIPADKVGNCEDAMNWRVSLFRVTAESAMFCLVILMANISYGHHLGRWSSNVAILFASYFLVFSGVRSIFVAMAITLPLHVYFEQKRLSPIERRRIFATLIFSATAIIALPYILGRGEKFWQNYFLRTESCDYKIRYLIPGHSESVPPSPQPQKVQPPEFPVARGDNMPARISPPNLPTITVDQNTSPREDKGLGSKLSADWIKWTINRSCSVLFQWSLFLKSPFGSKNMDPHTDDELTKVGCPPKMLSRYCSSCNFVSYWLTRAGVFAIPLIMAFALLTLQPLKRKEFSSFNFLLPFSIVSISWGVMFVPYNFAFLLMLMIPAFVKYHENLLRPS